MANHVQKRKPVFEMTLQNVLWPFFEREGHCASCGERIAAARDPLLCADCAVCAHSAKITAAGFDLTIELE